MKNTRLVIATILSLMVTACGNPQQPGNGVAAVADVGKIYHWKMVTTWPANFPIFQEGAERFADEVRTMSGGRLDIQVFAGGELVPSLGVFDAVSQGSVEMGHGSPYYWAGKIPAVQFFSAVPFGMTAKGMEAWLYHGGGLELWRELYARFNLVPIPMGNTGVQMGGWFNKKINSIGDIRGLRMRIPGLGGKVLSRAGGNPILMAGGEIYTALERGTIDATEWVAPFHDMRLGLNRAAKYYYYPGWHEPGTEFELMINADDWRQLAPDLQKIVEVAAAESGKWIYTAMEFHNQQALQELKQKKNIEMLEFPPEVLTELQLLTAATLREEAEKDADFKRVYQAYEAFRKTYADWDRVADGSYQRSIRE